MRLVWTRLRRCILWALSTRQTSNSRRSTHPAKSRTTDCSWKVYLFSLPIDQSSANFRSWTNFFLSIENETYFFQKLKISSLVRIPTLRISATTCCFAFPLSSFFLNYRILLFDRRQGEISRRIDPQRVVDRVHFLVLKTKISIYWFSFLNIYHRN